MYSYIIMVYTSGLSMDLAPRRNLSRAYDKTLTIKMCIEMERINIRTLVVAYITSYSQIKRVCMQTNVE